MMRPDGLPIPKNRIVDRIESNGDRLVFGVNSVAWASLILFLAALYNLAWGSWVALAPQSALEFMGLDPSVNRPLVQCMGMLVGVYGIAYGIASTDPVRYWPLVFVGLVGKVLGPIGAVFTIFQSELPVVFLWTNVTNDLIWWIPFAWILIGVRQGRFPSGSIRVDRGIYPDLLGRRFEDIGEELQRFHSGMGSFRYHGSVAVSRSPGKVKNWFADRWGLPGLDHSGNLELLVERRLDGETWIRSFPSLEARSEQKISAGLLTERWGRVTIHLQLGSDPGGLWLRGVRSTFWGCPLPPFLAPRVRAKWFETQKGIEFSVLVDLPSGAPWVSYAGWVRPK